MPKMTSRNEKDRGRSKLFVPDGSAETDRLIEETQQLLVNTKIFLERLQESEDATRKYVENLRETLENDLRRLKRKRSDEGPSGTDDVEH